MFSNKLSFLSSLNVSDHVSHPYKNTRTRAIKFIIQNNLELLKIVIGIYII